MATDEQVAQIKADVEELQNASAAAANQIAELTDQVLALQEGQITDDQIDNLHNALSDVTSELVRAVKESQAALGTQSEAPFDQNEQGEQGGER